MFLASAIAGVTAAQQSDLPEPIRKLKPMLDGVQPITAAERAARIEKARRLMREHKMSAIYLESGTSMYYFTGNREPGQAWILPLKGEALWTPAEPARAAQALRDSGIATGTLGLEEQVRFAAFDGLRKEAPALEAVSATPVTAGCRMIKSPAEIALLLTISPSKPTRPRSPPSAKACRSAISAPTSPLHSALSAPVGPRWPSSASTPPSPTAAYSPSSSAKATWS
jgi:hypothetical protein